VIKMHVFLIVWCDTRTVEVKLPRYMAVGPWRG